MRFKKFIIALLGLILLLSLIGSVSAAGLTAEIEPKTAHVGDTVTLTVTANNDGLYDWYPVIIAVTHSSGLKFQSFIVPDKTLQNYDESTGIWNVNRMRHEERGLLKTLVITYKVMPSAAGKSLTASARFTTLKIEATGDDITNNYRAARADSLTVSSSSTGNTGHGNGTGNGTGTGTGSGTGNGNGTGSGNGKGNGNGNSLIDASGNSKLASAIGNLTSSNKNSPLKSLQGGGGGGGSGKAYEVTTTPKKTDPDYIYILVALLLIGLILAGYFYGVRRE